MGFTMAVSCMDASLYNKWLCLLISLFALSCLSVTSILWPCLAPLSLPFKSLPPLSKFTVCMRVSCIVHAHVWMHTQVLHETLWVFLSLDGSFPSFLFIQMLLPHVSVPRAVRTSSLWCGVCKLSMQEPVSGWKRPGYFFLLPLSVDFSLNTSAQRWGSTGFRFPLTLC